ncbi:MAG: radical SAM protein [Planctomycetota bacterium]
MPRLRTKRFLRVKLDMVNRCQLRCVMCHFAHPDFVESMDDMDRPLLEKIAAQVFPLAHDVVLSSSAEPTMAPELPRALELCREYDVPYFHFSTNAMSLTERLIRKVIEVGMPVMTISTDGCTRETFEKIRVPAKWDKFLSKLELVARVRRDTGSDVPRLSVTAVLMKDNIEEMPGFLRFYAGYGVREFNFVHMGVLGGMGMEGQSLVHRPRLSNEVLAECRRVAAELGVALTAPLPFPADLEVGDDVASSMEGGGEPSSPGRGGRRDQRVPRPQEPRVQPRGLAAGRAPPDVLLPVVLHPRQPRRHGVPLRPLVRVLDVRGLPHPGLPRDLDRPAVHRAAPADPAARAAQGLRQLHGVRHGPARRPGQLLGPREAAHLSPGAASIGARRPPTLAADQLPATPAEPRSSRREGP